MMVPGYVISLLLLYLTSLVFPGSTSAVVEEVCPAMSRDCLLDYYKDLTLARRSPVKIGHITELSLENEQIREMKTLSMKPPLFEIPNYLSPEECDDIIRLARESGLQTSSTMDEDVYEDEKNYDDEDQHETFKHYDYNGDRFLDVDEVLRLLDTEMDFSPDTEDVIDMFKTVHLDKDGDLKISVKEFENKDIRGLVRYVSLTKRNKPYTKSRNSNQTWLSTDRNSEKTLQSLRRRLQKLTQLPMVLLNASESLQVVSYGPRGHYNCHMDSDDLDPKTKCCHFLQDVESDCRICRYLTVLYFLSDVEEGGETAFPLADNETFDEDVWYQDVKSACNVGRNCHKSNIRVKPEKGKAILWYTHVINDETGWLGESDPYSHHGGCDVKKGTKWIANNWITVSEKRTDDIEFWIKKLQNPDDRPIRKGKSKSNSQDDSRAVDDVFQAVETENTRKQEEINTIFDTLEHSDVEDANNREEL